MIKPILRPPRGGLIMANGKTTLAPHLIRAITGCVFVVALFAIFPLGYFKSDAEAVTLTATNGVTDFGAPSSFAFTFLTPYIGGPFNAAAASVGGTLADATGDGASASGTFTAGVDATTIFTIPFSCSIGAGGAGAMASCPSGGSAATTKTTSFSTGSATLSHSLTFGLSGGGDAAVFITTVVLSDSSSGSQFFLIAPIAVIDLGAPSTFLFTFSSPFIGPRDSVSVGLLGAIMDSSGDGASITNLLDQTFIDATEVTAVQITGNCSVGPGTPQVISSCLGDIPYVLPSVTNFVSPASGTLNMQVSFNLSGGGDALALISSVSIFNAQEVPEPSSIALTLLGLGAFGLFKRSLRRPA